MLGSRIRNSKQRVLVFVVVACVFLLGIYVLRDTHIKLSEARSISDRCQQQHESLSAQLQVVYEHKSRLEKSLQQEKVQHKKTKDDITAQLQELQDVKEKEKQEAGNRFTSLQQQHKMIQIQNEDLQEELNKVQESNIELMREKQQQQTELDNEAEVTRKKDLENGRLKAKISSLQLEIETLTRDLADRDKKMHELADNMDACEKQLDELRITKLSQKPNTYSVEHEKLLGKSEVGPEIPVERKVHIRAPQHAGKSESKRETAKRDAPKLGDYVEVKPGGGSFNKNPIVLERRREPEYQQSKDDLHIQDVGPRSIEKGPAEQGRPMGMGLRPMGLNKHKEMHQLRRPQVPLVGQESLEEPRQIALPENGRNLNQKVDEDEDEDGHRPAKIPVGREEEFQGHNGLEQQENGDDQDLDNMEDDDNARHRGKVADVAADDNKAFDDTDFDQIGDELGVDSFKKSGQKHDAVMLAPI